MKYRNILLIDDDDDDQEIFLRALSEVNSSIKFEGLYDARDALNKLSKKELFPDAIFLDLNMPVMNGFQFLELLKSKDFLRDIPVIIYTTSSQLNTIKLAEDLGAQEVVTKPGKYIDLVNILRSLLT